MRGLGGRFLKAPVLFLFVFMVFSLSLTRFSLCARADAGDEASAAIGEAYDALRRAFEAVLEAEEAGENVSSLIVKLDEAGRLLAEAENAYRVGNFSEAVGKAEECSVLADGLRGEAAALKGLALAGVKAAFWQNLVFTVMGSTVFLFVLFFVWGWFKRFYVRKLLRMKPEVAVDVED